MKEHRRGAYEFLKGRGLEIGALNEPAALGPQCQVEYFDAITPEAAVKLFPEIDHSTLVPVTYLGDLDRDGLSSIEPGRFDFVIINHVIEHVANPVRTLGEVFRVLRQGGCAVISVPDKRFTFDRHRPDTTWEHLLEDYQAGTQVSSDQHYVEFLQSAAPHVFQEIPLAVEHHVNRARIRREHAHAWTSATFRAHLLAAFQTLGVRATVLYESTGDDNKFEYISVWRKT